MSALLPAHEYRLGNLRIRNARHLQGERTRYREELSESAKQGITRETDTQTGRAMGTQGGGLGFEKIKQREKPHENLF